MGLFQNKREVETASADIYRTGKYASAEIELGLLSIGKNLNPGLKEDFPNVQQIVWRDVTDFIFNRFATYERHKREHPQWDLDGHLLWHAYREHRKNRNNFSSSLFLIATRPDADEIGAYVKQNRID
jgi:hypothetical protein